MGKKHYRIIFVVLVYRNTSDLKDFFESNHIKDSKTIVVNSYYDSKTNHEFETIAFQHDADYISVENKGYGFGNNAGINYACEHYYFDYLIISNADITIEKFDINILNKFEDSIVAPKILTLKGKNQNPSSPFKPYHIIEKFKYLTYKKNYRFLIYGFYALSRFNKIIYYTIQNLKHNVFSPHGAFTILSYGALQKLVPLFNEEMFLFCEEEHLGRKALQNDVKIIYEPDIVIRHKEDGSVSLLSQSLFSLMRQSFMTYYEYWSKKNKV